MKILGKITSVLVMIISAVLLLAFLAGVVGVWWGQAQLKPVVTELSATVDNSLERTQTAVGMVNAIALNNQARIEEAKVDLAEAGTKIEETNLALAAAERLLDQDLTPTVERVSDGVSAARDTIALIDKVLGLLNFLPGASDSKLLAVADSAVEKVKSLGQAVAELRTTAQTTKSQATAEAVSRLTAPLDRASLALGAVSADMVELGQRIDTRQAQLASLTQRVLTGITIAAIALTLALLWMAIAQLGLFLHAYGAFTGRDPLPRWHKGTKSGEAPPVAPQTTGGVA